MCIQNDHFSKQNDDNTLHLEVPYVRTNPNTFNEKQPEPTPTSHFDHVQQDCDVRFRLTFEPTMFFCKECPILGTTSIKCANVKTGVVHGPSFI